MQQLSQQRAFDFSADTFSFSNELLWEYRFDGPVMTTVKRSPPPAYAHHCVVVARSVRQFFFHARFAPAAPAVNDDTYRALIRSVVARSDYRPSPDAERIEIAGFANLRQFSAARAPLLRAHCGGSWQSYVQRANWRMILPFSRAGQERAAVELLARARAAKLPIIHLVTFPRLTINHTVMVLSSASDGEDLIFDCYDPNICEEPLRLSFNRRQRSFIFPRTCYFPGGPVNAYEIFRDAWF